MPESTFDTALEKARRAIGELEDASTLEPAIDNDLARACTTEARRALATLEAGYGADNDAETTKTEAKLRDLLGPGTPPHVYDPVRGMAPIEDVPLDITVFVAMVETPKGLAERVIDTATTEREAYRSAKDELADGELMRGVVEVPRFQTRDELEPGYRFDVLLDRLVYSAEWLSS